MPEYVVTRKSDGAEVYRYSHTEPLDLHEFPFNTHDHVIAPPAPPVEVPLPPKPWHITKLAFRRRYTEAEKVGIELAALDNIAAPMATRQASAALRAYMKDLETATFIDLDRPDTRAGVQQLEAMGLIAQGRAAQILDTPPTETEVWNG